MTASRQPSAARHTPASTQEPASTAAKPKKISVITTLNVSVDAASVASVTTFSNATPNVRQIRTALASQSREHELTTHENSLQITAVPAAAAPTCALSRSSARATSFLVTTVTQTQSASLTCAIRSPRNALVRTRRKWSPHSEKT